MESFYYKYGKLKPEIENLPKYAKLRNAVLAAIDDKYWSMGDKLPSESELCRLTPFSLGTVQKALRTLVEEGILVRMQGHGTFVAETRRRMDRPWNLRFASETEGVYLPVYPKVVQRKRITCDSQWARLLNPTGTNIIQIDRTLDVNAEFTVYCRMYLNGDTFDGLLEKDVEDLERVNLKALIRSEYDLPTTHMSYALRLTELPENICRIIGVKRGAVGLIYEIFASSEPKKPIYYQETYIPPNQRRLHISDISNISEYWMK